MHESVQRQIKCIHFFLVFESNELWHTSCQIQNIDLLCRRTQKLSIMSSQSIHVETFVYDVLYIMQNLMCSRTHTRHKHPSSKQDFLIDNWDIGMEPCATLVTKGGITDYSSDDVFTVFQNIIPINKKYKLWWWGRLIGETPAKSIKWLLLGHNEKIKLNILRICIYNLKYVCTTFEKWDY
jgi:hypothetical protein